MIIKDVDDKISIRRDIGNTLKEVVATMLGKAIRIDTGWYIEVNENPNEMYAFICGYWDFQKGDDDKFHPGWSNCIKFVTPMFLEYTGISKEAIFTALDNIVKSEQEREWIKPPTNIVSGNYGRRIMSVTRPMPEALSNLDIKSVHSKLERTFGESDHKKLT